MNDSPHSDRALVVLHATQTRLSALPGGEGIVRFIQGELRYFRERGRLVIFALPPDPKDPAGLACADAVVADLTPRTHEHLLATKAPSAFFETPLDRFLRDERVRRVTLVGVDAAKEVLLTAADAMARGFRVVVPEPCVASTTEADKDAALHFMNELWVTKKEEATEPAFVDDGPR